MRRVLIGEQSDSVQCNVYGRQRNITSDEYV